MRAGLGLLLFLACFYKLTLSAALEELGGDETTDIAGSYDQSFGDLLLHGPHMELNTSPLHYLLGRAWINSWNRAPQLHWDSRIFFRVLPMAWWSLLAVVLFLFLLRLLEKFKWRPEISYVAAFSASIFLFSRHFPTYYAILSRPYSLWLLLTFLHLLAFLRLYEKNCSRKDKYAFLALCLALPFTAFVSAAQVAVAMAVLFIFPPGGRARSFFGSGAPLLCSALIGGWYLLQLRPGNAGGSRIDGVLMAFLDILAVSTQPYTSSFFAERNLDANWATASGFNRLWAFVVIIIPAYSWWRRPMLRPFLAFAYVLIISLGAIALVLALKGQVIGHSRYLLFLFPFFTGLLFISVYELASLASKAKATPILLTGLSAILAAQAVNIAVTDVRGNLSHHSDLLTRSFYWQTPKESCPANLAFLRNGKQGIETESLLALCRP